jgi:hypothetical protein
MSRLTGHLARHGVHLLSATALNYIVLSLPSPAKELVDVGVPGLSAYVACLSARASNVLKAFVHRY